MKVIFSREPLLRACSLALGIVPSRNIKPVLSNLLIEVNEHTATVAATDLDTSIRCKVGGYEPTELGWGILPAATLVAVLKNASDERLAIEVTNSGGKVTGEKWTMDLPSNDPTNFPEVPRFDYAAYHEVNAGELLVAMSRTTFAASTEVGRYAYCGTRWVFAGNKSELVATDGKRLAIASLPMKTVGEAPASNLIIVPRPAMLHLPKLLDAEDMTVRVAVGVNDIAFDFAGGEAMLATRLLEGKFPDYTKLLDTKPPRRLALPAAELHAALRQAAIGTDADSPKVTFELKGNKLTLSAQSSQGNRSKVELIVAGESQKLKTLLNPSFRLGFLKAADKEQDVRIQWTDGDKPQLWSQEGFKYVVMPMN